MIETIELNNFKSHKNTNIEIGNLTVLCGSNGVGKSSFIQILLLLREAFIKDKSFEILDLKSNPIKIGTVSDAVYEFGEYDGFQVKLKFDNDLIRLCIDEERHKIYTWNPMKDFDNILVYSIDNVGIKVQ